MIRVSALYPNATDAHFDFDYYRNRHMPEVMDLLKSYGAQRFEVEHGLCLLDGSNPPYIAIGHIVFDNLDGLKLGLSAHSRAILSDIPHYTNQTPIIQISEIL